MIEELKRTTDALAGAMAGAALVALVEARTVFGAAAGANAPTLPQLFVADMAVLAPLAIAVGLLTATAHMFLEPGPPEPLTAHLGRARREPVLARSRTAAMWPLAIGVALAWTIASAHIARAGLAHGTPIVSGLSLAVSSMALLFALLAVALALLPLLRRLLAAGADTAPVLIDPVATGGAALVLALGALVAGIALGDTGGDGAWPLGVLGVMKRRELDLRPVVNLVVVAIGAYLVPVALAGRPGAARPLLTLLAAFVPLFVTAVEARALDEQPHVARAIERYAPLGKIALASARTATDRDRDGASGLFAGGDCDDRDPKIHPSAIDVPGNGIDEDCSGADTIPPPPPLPPPPPPPPSSRIPDDMNLVLITIDTLRTDTGFMGYERDTTPNLDKLAAKSTVFDHAYSMASYTGKSLGPMLIGKYPNETDRDGGHFNVYAPSNTFVAERLKKAGFFTMGAASHWYFNPWSGLAQGIQNWDLSARPWQGQGETDTSITSDKLADASIKLLSAPENTDKRFFFWVHFFDPHAQYMPHPEAPEFLDGPRGPTATSKAAYDAEVWFTDVHLGRVLDHIAAQPWGKKTAIIVTADHGEAFADHGMSFHGGELWESLVHVPLVVYVPGLEGHHVPVKRGHIDLVPTMLDLMKLPLPDLGELRGASLLPDLLGKEGGEYVERDVYLDMPAGPFNLMRRGILTGPTPGKKLIHFGANQYQLFDLAADPGEKDDLARDKEQIAPVLEAFRALRAPLKEIEVKPDAPPPPD